MVSALRLRVKFVLETNAPSELHVVVDCVTDVVLLTSWAGAAFTAQRCYFAAVVPLEAFCSPSCCRFLIVIASGYLLKLTAAYSEWMLVLCLTHHGKQRHCGRAI